MRNNSVNLFRIWASGTGGDVALAALLLRGAEPFMQF